MSHYGGQKRDLILEPVSGPISASLEGASIVPIFTAGMEPISPRYTRIRCFEEKDKAIQTRIDELQGLKVQVWRTRKGVYRKKQYPDIRNKRNAHTEG